MTQPPPPPSGYPPQQAPGPPTSGLAVASLVCGIGGVCTCGLGGIAGIVLGIMAMGRIKRSGGQLGGRGLAVAGLVVSIIAIIVGLAIIAGTGAVWFYARRQYDVMQFSANVRVLCEHVVTYSAVNDGRLPPPDSWPDALMAEGLITDLDILTDPADPGAGRAIAMNRAVVRAPTYDVARAGDTVLLFECAPGSPLSGGRDLLPPAPRHAGGYVIGFLDGRTRQVPPERLDRLVWNPKPG